jgi:hypothetical protein
VEAGGGSGNGMKAFLGASCRGPGALYRQRRGGEEGLGCLHGEGRASREQDAASARPLACHGVVAGGQLGRGA